MSFFVNRPGLSTDGAGIAIDEARQDLISRDGLTGGLGVLDDPKRTFFSSFTSHQLKDIFKDIRYHIQTNELVYQPLRKLITFPLTSWNFRPHDPNDVQDFNAEETEWWLHFFDDELQLKDKAIDIGVSLRAFGNAFVSVYVQYNRYLVCSRCENQVLAYSQANPNGPKYRYKSSAKKFQMKKCQNNECGASDVTCELKDIPIANKKSFSIKVWDVLSIDIENHDLSSKNKYFYKLPPKTVAKIKGWKDYDYLNGCPPQFIKAAYGLKRRVKLVDDNLFHFTHNFDTQHMNGWGFPPMLSSLFTITLLQTLRKANEAIARGHMNPIDIIYPVSTPAIDIAGDIEMASLKQHLTDSISYMTLDKNGLILSPVPIGKESIRGMTGRNLFTVPEMKQLAEQIIAGMGAPIEFMFGGLSYSGTSVSMRMLENDLFSWRNQLLAFTNNFIIPKVHRLMKKPRPKVGMTPFRMADDIQMKSLMVQLEAQKKISKRKLFEILELDTQQEHTSIVKETGEESDVKIAMAKADARAESAMRLESMHADTAQIQAMVDQQKISRDALKRAGMPLIHPVTGAPLSADAAGLPPEAQQMAPVAPASEQLPMSVADARGILDGLRDPDLVNELLSMDTGTLDEATMAGEFPQEIADAAKTISMAKDQTDIGMDVDSANELLGQADPEIIDQLMGMAPDELYQLVVTEKIPPDVAQAIGAVKANEWKAAVEPGEVFNPQTGLMDARAADAVLEDLHPSAVDKLLQLPQTTVHAYARAGHISKQQAIAIGNKRIDEENRNHKNKQDSDYWKSFYRKMDNMSKKEEEMAPVHDFVHADENEEENAKRIQTAKDKLFWANQEFPEIRSTKPGLDPKQSPADMAAQLMRLRNPKDKADALAGLYRENPQVFNQVRSMLSSAEAAVEGMKHYRESSFRNSGANMSSFRNPEKRHSQNAVDMRPLPDQKPPTRKTPTV